jgi:hypothetical protein
VKSDRSGLKVNSHAPQGVGDSRRAERMRNFFQRLQYGQSRLGASCRHGTLLAASAGSAPGSIFQWFTDYTAKLPYGQEIAILNKDKYSALTPRLSLILLRPIIAF